MYYAGSLTIVINHDEIYINLAVVYINLAEI